MPAFILLGWLVGTSLAVMLASSALTAFGFALPALIIAFLNPLMGVITLISATIGAMLVMLMTVIIYVIAYVIATMAIRPLLPGLVGGPVTFPLTTPANTPTAAPVTVPATIGESFARGAMIGLTAGLNLILLSVLPVWGLWIGGWAFLMLTLGAVPAIARNRIFQGFLGWSAWLFPMSYFATAIGLALFIVNIPFSFTALGLNAFRIDWTTGVITSSEGLITIFNGMGGGGLTTLGFSLGNFVFLNSMPALGDFTASSTASHETGHSLNTALMGGIVLWINGVDENLWPASLNLAYGELAAEGHARAMPPPPGPGSEFSLRIWF